MGERKVLNKYFPPDFDPEKIPRTKKSAGPSKFVVRMMLPMSVRCSTCGEYMYKGKKFNSRKEDVEGPEGEYLGIKILRFYFKCVTCSAEFTIKTDPQNMDYVVEGGARANYVPYKDEANQRKAALDAREASEKDDTMAQLENKTKDSKMEMDILDALDDIRSQNNRVARLELDEVIERHNLQTQREHELAEQRRLAATSVDDDEVALFAEQRIKRLRDDEVHAAASAPRAAAERSMGIAAAGKKPRLPPGFIVQSKAAAGAGGASSGAAATLAPVVLPVATPVPAAPAAPAPTAVLLPGATGSALLGLGGYGSGSGSSSPPSDEAT
jgi:DNA-directed RNA polymerase subunit RPC12/RpoP